MSYIGYIANKNKNVSAFSENRHIASRHLHCEHLLPHSCKQKLTGAHPKAHAGKCVFFAATAASPSLASSTHVATVTPGIYTLKDDLVQKISKIRCFRRRPDDRRRHHSHRTPGIYAMKKRFGPPFSGKFRNFSGHPLPRPTSHIGYISKKSESGNGFMEKIPTFFGRLRNSRYFYAFRLDKAKHCAILSTRERER